MWEVAFVFFELLGSRGCEVTDGETKGDMGIFILGVVYFFLKFKCMVSERNTQDLE